MPWRPVDADPHQRLPEPMKVAGNQLKPRAGRSPGPRKLKHAQLTRMGGLKVPIFEITVTIEGGELGAAKYGTCYPCGVGLLQGPARGNDGQRSDSHPAPRNGDDRACLQVLCHHWQV